jgi:hypothetical protein
MSGLALERVRVVGPLAGFADGYRAHLLELGYSLSGARDQFDLLVHASRWMEAEGLDLVLLTSPVMLKRHVIWRREQGYLRSLSSKSLRGLVGYLDGLGVLARDEGPVSPVDELLDAFGRYLLQERGLAALTVQQYEGVARRFLVDRSEPLADDLARLSGAAVNAFVLRESRGAPRLDREGVCGVRALLRFLHVQGLMAEPLAAAVPAVARRREDLPRGLAPGEVKRLLDSCDRCTAVDGRSCSTAVRRLVPSPLPWRSGATAVRPRAAMRSLSPTRTAATKRPPTRSDRVAAHRTPPNHERTPAIARLPRSVRGRSNLCPSPDQDHELRFSARSPSAVGAAGTGVEAVKGQLPGQHGCPRGRAPGCRSLKPSRSPPQSGQAPRRTTRPSRARRRWSTKQFCGPEPR